MINMTVNAINPRMIFQPLLCIPPPAGDPYEPMACAILHYRAGLMVSKKRCITANKELTRSEYGAACASAAPHRPVSGGGWRGGAQ
jgi:hypothetical protein